MATKTKKTAKKTAPKKTIKKGVKKAAPKSKKPLAKKVAPKKAKKTVVKKQAKKIPTAKKVAIKKVAIKKVVVKKVVSKKGTHKQIDKKSVATQNGPKAEVQKHARNPISQPRVNKIDDNRARYNDKELLEFKHLIEEKMEVAQKDLKYWNDQINRKDDNGTDDTENKFGSTEDGSLAIEREFNSQMASRQATYIDHLEKAGMRIKNKTYGICRITGKLIDKDRLRAVPHATLSMEAKENQSK